MPIPALKLLQQKFSDAIVFKQQEKNDFTIFVVDSNEKHLITQYEHEEEIMVARWLWKNNFEFSNRIRIWFF